MSWTGSAGLVPLKPPTPGLQETTLPAKVTIIPHYLSTSIVLKHNLN